MSGRDGADAPYWEGLEAGRLMLPRCNGCDRWMWPAGHRCGACGTVGIYWAEQPMRATVFSWTRTWHPFAGTKSIATPFTNVVAEVAGSGIRLLGRLEDPDRIDPIIGESLLGRPTTTEADGRSISTILWSRAA